MGSSITHIANAYDEDIEVRVDKVKANQITQQKSSVSGKVGGNYSGARGNLELGVGHCKSSYEPNYDWGFTRIESGSYLAFDVRGDDGKVYVTIKSGSKVIAQDFSIENNCSLIVSRKGYVKRTKMGEIWIDREDINHKRLSITLENFLPADNF